MPYPPYPAGLSQLFTTPTPSKYKPFAANDPLEASQLEDIRIGEQRDRYNNELKLPDNRDAILRNDALLQSLQGEADTDPYTGAAPRARQADFQKLMDSANLQGFGSPQEAAAAAKAAEARKELYQSPAYAEQIKGEELRKTNAASDALIRQNGQPPQTDHPTTATLSVADRANLLAHGWQSSETEAPIPYRGDTPLDVQNLGSTPPPAQSQSWWDFLTKHGSANHYSGAQDLASIASEKVKSWVMPTPLTNAIQGIGIANIENMQGLLPGVRGVGNVSQLFKDIQSNLGHEAPSATYLRLANMKKAFADTAKEMDDPANTMKTVNGRLERTQLPQTMLRAHQAIADSVVKTDAVMRLLEQQYPGIEQVVGDVTPGAPPRRPPDKYDNQDWGSR